MNVGRDSRDRCGDARATRSWAKAHSNALPQDRVHDAGRRRFGRGSSRSPGRNEEAVSGAAARYGYERWTTDWRDLVADPRSGSFDNRRPRTRSTPSRPIAAAEAGKPSSARSRSAGTPTRATTSGRRVAATGRQAPMRVQLPLRPCRPPRARADRRRRARRDPPLPRALPPGLGRRPTLDAWRFDAARGRAPARSATSARTSSTSRGYLVGEIDDGRRLRQDLPPRTGRSTTRSRPPSQFENGADRHDRGDAARARAAAHAFQWEINGTEGSLAFDMERLNELQVFRADGDRARGFKTVLVSEADHPFWEHWWPPGHIIGWGDTFVHELHHLLRGDREATPTSPRMARRSRTATARPRSATRSCGRPIRTP